MVSLFGGDGETRTHVPVRANAFRVRPVMTASIRLRVELFGTLIANCKAGSNFTALKVREKCRKCEKNEEKTRFRETPRDETEMISSQPRYDHFDISPSMLNSVLEYNDYSIFYRTGRPVMSCCGARNFSLAVRFAKFRPLPLLFAPFIRHRRRSQTSPLRYLSVY